MLKTLLFSFLISTLSMNVSAVEVAGVTFNDTIANSKLQLNGAGIRYKFVIKVYAAALYVESPSHDENTVIMQEGAKRLILHILYDDISREKMVDSMVDGFQDNLTSEEHRALKQRIDQLLTHYQGVKENDVLEFDYSPNQGTTFRINGTQKTTIQGADFNQALLKIWIGSDPATSSLKEALLGKQ